MRAATVLDGDTLEVLHPHHLEKSNHSPHRRLIGDYEIFQADVGMPVQHDVVRVGKCFCIRKAVET